MSSRVVRSLMILAFAVAFSAGLALGARPGGGGGCSQPRPNCICPMVYDPVVCDGSCTYSNSCVANCAGARNCVPSGGGPVALGVSPTEEAPAASPAVETADDPACVAESGQALEADALAGFPDGPVANEASARRCKPCKDRPWCGCTYNGLPRVSCNPCCYGNYGVPQVCLD